MVHFQRKATIVSVLGLFALACTACGGSPTAAAPEESAAQAVYKQFDEADGSTRMDELVKAAETEGAVTVYLRSDDVFLDIEKAFEAKYDVDLKIINPGKTQVVRQQIFEQANAGKLEADVVETYIHELNTMFSESNLVAPMPAFLGEVAPKPELVSEYGIESFQYPFIPVWNDTALPGDKAPKKLADLADDSFKDKLVMVKGYEPWYMTEFQKRTADGMSQEEFETLFKKLASNASSADSSNPAAAGIASGQYEAGAGIALVAPQRLGESAPVAWGIDEESSVIVPAGIGLLREAKHPAAAMLFAQWYLTEGSDILVDEQFVEQNDNEKDLQGNDFVRPNLDGLDGKKLDAWRSAYENLLKGSGPVIPEYINE